MAIVVQCVCGKTYRMDDDKGGRKLRCRSCDAIMRIPAATPKPRKSSKPRTAVDATRPRPAAASPGAKGGESATLDAEIEIVLEDDAASEGEILVLDLGDDGEGTGDSDAELTLDLGNDEEGDAADSAELPALDLLGETATSAADDSAPARPPAPPAAAGRQAGKRRTNDPPPSDDVMEIEFDDDPDDPSPPVERVTKGGDANPFAFLESDRFEDEDDGRVPSPSARSRAQRPRPEEDVDEVEFDPDSDESIEVRDDATDDDVVFDSDDELPAASRKSKGAAAARSKRRGGGDDLDDEEDDDLPDDVDREPEEDSPWPNFVWAGGLTIVAIAAFFYLKWMEAQGDEFTGEGGRGLQKLLAWAYSIGGAWAVSGVLLAVAAFFGWCGYTELAAQRERAARERRRQRIKARR